MNKYFIPNLSEACKILKTLVLKNKGFTISEIAREHNLPRTSVMRIVKTLVHENFLREESKLYYPGTSLIHLGLATLNNIDIQNVSKDVLKELTSKTGETSHIAVRMKDRSLLLEVYDSPELVKVSSKAGTLTHLHCSSTGKIFIANMEDKELIEFCQNNELEKRTKNTITSLSKLIKEKEKILSQGYAFDDEEYHEHVRCLAAPIKDAYGKVVAAIGITATITRFTYDKLDYYADTVKDAASKISQKLGYTKNRLT